MDSATPTTKIDVEVRRDDLRTTRTSEEAIPNLEPGQALIRIDRFGCTANNIIYAKLGDWLYWKFFPTEEGWGRVPAWGFGDVVDGGTTDLQQGTRIFGCFPMSSHLIVAPAMVDKTRFVDGPPHRAGLPSAYSNYTVVPGEADRAGEDLRLLLRPLYLTSYLIVDMLQEQRYFGAGTVLVSSASSKTALGVARLLQRLDVHTVGLTSAGHKEFVERLGVYDEVADYDQVAALPVKPAVFVDVAGSGVLRRAVHSHFGQDLAYSAKVGSTHWDLSPVADVPDLPGPTPTLFFAPDRMVKRGKDWGRDGFNRNFDAAFGGLIEWTATWLHVDHHEGTDAVRAVYRDVLDGRVSPGRAFVVSISSS